MKRLKVKMIGSGTPDNPYRVDLPTWQGLKFDTDKGIYPPKAKAVVLVPDDECTPGGRISRATLRKKYAGSLWEKHEPDIGQEEPVE